MLSAALATPTTEQGSDDDIKCKDEGEDEQEDISPKQKRVNMIVGEMDTLLEDAQQYILKHMMDEIDLDEEAKVALKLAAMECAYTKRYYDIMEDNVVYFPSCKKLIMNGKLTEVAEKYYYDEGDEFPPEYTKALRAVVSIAGSRKIKDSGRKGQKLKDTPDDDVASDDDREINDESGDDDSLIGKEEQLGSELMEKLAMSWREAFDESLRDRMALV